MVLLKREIKSLNTCCSAQTSPNMFYAWWTEQYMEATQDVLQDVGSPLSGCQAAPTGWDGTRAGERTAPKPRSPGAPHWRTCFRAGHQRRTTPPPPLGPPSARARAHPGDGKFVLPEPLRSLRPAGEPGGLSGGTERAQRPPLTFVRQRVAGPDLHGATDRLPGAVHHLVAAERDVKFLELPHDSAAAPLRRCVSGTDEEEATRPRTHLLPRAPVRATDVTVAVDSPEGGIRSACFLFCNHLTLYVTFLWYLTHIKVNLMMIRIIDVVEYFHKLPPTSVIQNRYVTIILAINCHTAVRFVLSWGCCLITSCFILKS